MSKALSQHLRLWLLTLAMGCAVAQRPSVKVVDPTLREQGTSMQRARLKGGFGLGPYELSDVTVQTQPVDPDGPLAKDDTQRPIQQHRTTLSLYAPETGRRWSVDCILQRRASASEDYTAILDENGDEVAIDCRLKGGPKLSWRLKSHADLSDNFAATLHALRVGPEAPVTLRVEVLTRVVRLKRFRRLLPVPVAQVRNDTQAVAAMLLSRPEQTWVAADLDPVVAEVSVAAMLGLRFLPLQLAE